MPWPDKVGRQHGNTAHAALHVLGGPVRDVDAHTGPDKPAQEILVGSQDGVAGQQLFEITLIHVLSSLMQAYAQPHGAAPGPARASG